MKRHRHPLLSRRLALALALTLLPAAQAVDLAPADLHSRLVPHVPDLAPPSPAFTNGTAYLRSLAPRILPASVTPAPSGDAITRSNLYPGQIAYLRVAHVDDSLPLQLATAAASLARQESLQGLVLDLRSASGTNFASALRSARAFGEVPLAGLTLGAQPLIDPSAAPSASTPSPSLQGPLAILVNRQTRGAAELLAATLRTAASPSVVIGTNTAGQARAYRPLPLGDGLELQLAADPIMLPGGTPFPLSGLQPDLTVTVSEEDEALYLTDEYQRVVRGRRLAIDTSARLNEAELIRRRRGLRPNPEPAAEAPSRSVQDPALARALDLLETWAAERRPQPDGDSR
ncbi:MAG: hypothetical protein IT580_07465 [Verrucomicrobiales bacterium]|nr:hypothetical protein [Verrucomicrobiales bacterium]